MTLCLGQPSSNTLILYNLDIAERVIEELKSFSLSVTNSINIPYFQILSNNIDINFNNIANSMRTLLYPVILVYKKVRM